MKFLTNMAKLIDETRKGAVYAVITGLTLGVVILIGVFINRINMLERAVLGFATQNNTPGEILEATEGEKGERGEQGDIGLTGSKGEQGELPEGGWEEYCLYPKNEKGYRTEGALIRKSSGDCKNSWRTVRLWEK